MRPRGSPSKLTLKKDVEINGEDFSQEGQLQAYISSSCSVYLNIQRAMCAYSRID